MVREYHKIHSFFMRDDKNRIIVDDWARPEFIYLQDCDWVWTEKVDGTNIRIGYDGQVHFGGRTKNAVLPKPLLAELERMFPRELLAESFGETRDTMVILFGEGYGAGIQKGGAYRSTPSFVLFDVLVGETWLKRSDVVGCAETLGIDVVPVIGHGSLHEAIVIVRDGFKSPQWPNANPEGLVVRPSCELQNRFGERIIGKLKRCDFEALAA